MPNGTIKFFNAAKKFGFVTPDEGDKDVFVPVASVVAAGLSALTAGQRVSFDTEPDGKGPKAVNLVLIDTPAPPSAMKTPAPAVREQRRAPHYTFYHDASCDRSRSVLAALRDAGVDLREVDYVTTPPGREELKRLSMILQEGSGSLVRRYDPLFHDLRLDDRFISQNEFWDGIVENPTLINGPVLANAKSAVIFSSDNALKQFLAAAFPGHVHAAAEKKAAVPVAPQLTDAEPEAAEEDNESDTASAELAKPKARTSKAAPKAEKAKATPAAKKTVKKAAPTAAKKTGTSKKK
jgi:CspA family cold shock protein